MEGSGSIKTNLNMRPSMKNKGPTMVVMDKSSPPFKAH